MSAKFCHNCGSKLPEDAKFCGACGTAVLKTVPAEEIVSPPAPPEPQSVQSPVFTLDSLDAPQTVREEPTKKAILFTLDDLPERSDSEPVREPEPVSPESGPERQEPAHEEEPAAVEEPAEEEQSVPEKKTEKKKGWPRRGVGRTILAVLLCLLIFAWSFSTLALLNVRIVTGGDLRESTLENVVGAMDLTQLPASLLVRNLRDPDASVADWVVGQIAANYPGRVHAEPEALRAYLEDSAFNGFLAEQLGQCLENIYTGKGEAEITAADIAAVLTVDAPLIERVFEESLTPEDISAIADAAAESDALKLLSTESLRQQSPAVFKAVQICLSWWVIGAMILVLLLLILLLAKINRSVLRTCGDTGITLMVVSGIWAVGGLWYMVLPKVWDSLLKAVQPIGGMIGALMQSCLIPTACAFGVGTVLLLIKVIGKAIVTKSAERGSDN